MKSSLESLLAASLGELKELNSPVGDAIEQPGPVEGLGALTVEQIEEEVLEHLKEERYSGEDNLRQVSCDFFEQNELEHAKLQADINDVRETVATVVSSMEMLAVLTSMESLETDTVIAANNALSAIALQSGEPEAPMVVVDDGKITDASMESLVDFIKDAFGRLKKWIKEKFQNIQIAMRRGTMHRQVLLKRLDAVKDRLDSLPENYGIPSKPLRYDPQYTLMLFSDDRSIPLTASDFKAAVKDAMTLMESAIDKVVPDAAKRSETLADGVFKALTSRDYPAADTALREAFNATAAKLPIEAIVTRGKEQAGITFIDPALSYRSRYREAEWIMDLLTQLDMNQAMVKYRRVGQFDGKVAELSDLKALFMEVATLYEHPSLTNYAYYAEAVMAWEAASKAFNRMVGIGQAGGLTQMNHELWRAVDVGTSGMFRFIDKAYYHTEMCRAPAYRLLSGMLYVLEEQLKAYAAVNR